MSELNFNDYFKGSSSDTLDFNNYFTSTSEPLSPQKPNSVADSALEVAELISKPGQEAFSLGVAIDNLPQLIGKAGGTLSTGIQETVTSSIDNLNVLRKTLFPSFKLPTETDVTNEDKERVLSRLKPKITNFDGYFNNETPTTNSYLKEVWSKKAEQMTKLTENWQFSRPVIVALDEYYDAIGQRETWEKVKDYQNKAVDESGVMKIFNSLGNAIHNSAEFIEKTTGIPSEASSAAAELLLLKARVPEAITTRLGPSDKAVAKSTIEKKEAMVGPKGEKYDVSEMRNDYNKKRFSFVSGIEKATPYSKELLPSEQLVNDIIAESKRDTLNEGLKKVSNEKELIELTEMTVKNASKIDEVHAIKIIRSLRNELGVPLEGNKGLESLFKIRNYIEGKPNVKLSKKELNAVNNTLKPLLKQHKELVKRMQKENLLERNIKIPRGFNFMPRMRERPLKSIKEMLTGDRAKIQDPYAREVRSGASGAREYFVAVDKQGNRIPFGYIENGSGIATWTKNKNKEGRSAFIKNDELSQYQKVDKTDGSGQQLGPYKVEEARAWEIEDASGYIKHVDPIASLVLRINEMKQDLRLIDYNKSIMESPFMKDQVFEPTTRSTIPSQDYKLIAEDLGRLNKPLREQYMKTRTAEVLEDAFRTRKESWFTTVSNGMVKNMMLNSLPHMHNELIHWYLSRGMMRTFDPRSIARFRQDMVEAANDVLNKTQFYQDLLKEGSAMLGTNISNTLYMDKILRTTTKSIFPPKELSGYAKLTGRKLAEVYSAISDYSNVSMWQVRDMLAVQLVREKMRRDNIDMKEAIFRVEQHMPTYRLPPRVGEKFFRVLALGNKELGGAMARSLSKTLQNPNIVIFARYKHGMIKSAMNTVKDLYASKDIRGSRTAQKQIADGMDSALAMASAMYVIYPMMDYIFSEIFGNDSATMRRAGFLHVLQTLGYVNEGTKDMRALTANLLTVNPALMLLGEIVTNQTFYNGQPVYYTDDSIGQIAKDIGSKLVSTVPQVSAIASSGDVDGKWFARQIDVKIDSYEAQVKKQRRKEARLKAKIRRDEERAAGYD